MSPRALAPLFAIVLTGCPKHEPAPEAPHTVAPVTSAPPTASAPVAPLASQAVPAVSAEPPGPLVEPSTLGDTTCASDADCVITTRADCCECCASQAMATSRAWLTWRDGQCATTRCEPCGKVKCRWFEPASAFVARCVARSCVLQRAPTAGAIRDAKAALARFRTAFAAEIVPGSSGRVQPSQYANAVATAANARVRRVICRDAHARVDGTLAGSERTDLVFFGQIAALNRDGECWEVAVPTGHFNEILGYLDPVSGALVMVWLVPEG